MSKFLMIALAMVLTVTGCQSENDSDFMVSEKYNTSDGAEHAGQLLVPAQDFITIDLPRYMRVDSALVFGSKPGGGTVTANDLLVTQNKPTGALISYFPNCEGWVPVNSEISLLTIFNFGETPIVASVTFQGKFR